jgi:uncharacterized delta-60 repeat protein
MLRISLQPQIKSRIILCLSLLTSGCSTHSDLSSNYFLAETSFALLFAYSGEAFIPSPEFRAYKLESPLAPFTDFTGSVKLSAYSDSECTKAAPGTLTVATNPFPFTSGIAAFSSVSYALSSGAEGLIYLSGSIESDHFQTCGVSHSIIQHFNTGTGSIHFGFPGAAGFGTATTVHDQGMVQKITSAGNYIVAGNSKNAAAGTELALWRYLPTGTLDTTFNTTGHLSTGSPGAAGAAGAAEVETPVDLQIDSAGKYVVLGTSKNAAGGIELAVWRYNSDGTPDATFGTSGIFHKSTPGITGRNPAASVNDLPKAMIIDSEGNIIITGTSQNAGNGYEFFVARLTPLGVLDSSFGTTGVYHYGTTGVAGAINAAENDIGYGIQIASNGNYVIAGTSAYSGGGTELTLWKVSRTGLTLDTSFGNSGTVTYGTTGVALGTGANLSDVGRTLQIDASDSIIIAGASQNPTGGTEMAMWRYLSNGTLDTSFSTTGALHFNSTQGAAGGTGASENDMGLSLTIDTRYSFYTVAGTSVNASGGTQAALWRYTFLGKLDTKFNTVGSAVTPSVGTAGGLTAATVYDTANSLQLDAYGTYIVAGSTLNSSGGIELAIWRYLIIGLPDL